MKRLALASICVLVLLSAGLEVQAQCQLAKPVLLGPVGGGFRSFGSIHFDWNPVAGATSYELFIALGSGAPQSQGLTTETSKTVFIDPGHTVTWEVKAHAQNCTSSTSDPGSFRTGCGSENTTLLTPQKSARITEGSPVTFSWSDVPGRSSHDIYAISDSGHEFRPLAANVTGRSYTTTLPAGNWVWWLRTHNTGSCDSVLTANSQFSIGPACSSAAPTPVSPANGAKAKLPVTFSWTPSAGAERYELFVVASRVLYLIGHTTETSLRVDQRLESTFEWYVRAVFSGACQSLPSATRTLTVEPAQLCSEAKANPVSPANGATNLSSPVRFSWQSVAGATFYRVLAAINSSELVAVGTTTSTSLDAVVPAGTGYWVVQTFFGDDCPTTISDRRTLTVTTGGTCRDAGPVLIAPGNGATNVGSPVTFRWHPVQDAVKYAVFVSTGGDDFSFYGATDQTELESFVPDGTVRWFVAATFAGCPETRSSVFTFTAGADDDCPTGAITLRTPAPNASVTAPVTLSWSPLTGIDYYRVTVIVNGEASIGRRTNTTQEIFDLPAGSMRWYVEGVSDGCDPILSAEGAFTVQRGANCAANPAPSIVAPLGTEASPVTLTSPVTFSWNASTGALAYRLWVSRNGNAFEDILLTANTQVSIPLPAGSYSWFVDAQFSGCDPVASGRGYFSIADTTPRCPTGAPAPLSPAQSSIVPAPVLFRWAGIAGAEKYRVFLSLDGSEERLIGTTEETSLERVLPPGAARWRVEAIASECRALSSAVVEFTIPEASNCGADKPELVSPASGASLDTQDVDFSWTPVSGAVRYVVVAKNGEGAPVAIGDTAATSFRRRMPAGRNEWWVVAFFAGCAPRESSHSTFIIVLDQDCNYQRPIGIAPSESASRAIYSPVTFAWSRVPNAIGYQVWVSQGEDDPGIVAATTDNTAEVELDPGTYRWFVVARFAACAPTESAAAEFEVKPPLPCGTPEQPTAQVVGQALSGTAYRLRWTPLPNVDLYEVQESTSPSFDGATTTIVSNPVQRFVHDVTAPVQYLYRVRGISNCNDSRGSYSDPVGIFVVPPRTTNASAEVGVEGNIVQTLTLPGSPTPLNFAAKVDKPWLSVTPASGVLSATPVVLTVTADPASLYLGTNTGTVTVEYTTPSSGKVESHGTTFATIPVSISLVTPVTPVGKGTPPPDALIFPVVGHAVGANDSLFESDIRVANLTPQTMKYQVNFTPSGTDGTLTGSSTTIEIPPNTTTALDDIVASVFGTGTISSALGMLEVRPLTTSATSPSIFSTVSSAFPALSTAASSRTYNFTPNGTFGQFIPAVPFSKFAGKGAVLSLLQVAQSSAYRANFGFAEGGGAPVDLMVRVYDTKNTLLASIPVSLGATQHTQMGGLLTDNGITDLADGRVEVEVVGGDGKVTAYVSEIDNRTNDPLLVNAVLKGSTSANRYVVPGMAYINNGFAFWVSDLRIFNAGTTSTPATLTFYPQGNGAPLTRQITLDAGEIEVLDNVVGGLFAQPNGAGGAIAITTPTNTQLSATARTYNQTTSGTYGQFIPGVTAAESVGFGDRALQILQLETSSRFRTNIGLTETSGNPVTVEIIAIQPDSIVTPVITYDLAAGEFRQFSLADFFDAGAAVYNARVTVKVIGGTGRVTAYGSAIDVVTQDPTYVPAQ